MTSYFKTVHVEDKKYRASFRGQTCIACGIRDDTVVGAHIRADGAGKAGGGGLGYKPSDDMILPLCGPCHATEGRASIVFWETALDMHIDEVKAMARQRYAEWKAEMPPNSTGKADAN